jgi:hypothetical protein
MLGNTHIRLAFDGRQNLNEFYATTQQSHGTTRFARERKKSNGGWIKKTKLSYFSMLFG